MLLFSRKLKLINMENSAFSVVFLEKQIFCILNKICFLSFHTLYGYEDVALHWEKKCENVAIVFQTRYLLIVVTL